MKFEKIFYFLILGILLIIFGFFGKENSIEKSKSSIEEISQTVSVIDVIDGDTIKVDINGHEEAIRLIGIDTPEINDPRTEVECFGKESSQKAKEILSGKMVRLESDPTQGDRDKYGRLLRYVFVGDLNFNKLMISEGYGHEYTYQSNPYKHQSEFVQAAKEARENNRGLWQKC